MSDKHIPEMILMAQTVNRDALANGEPPVGLIAVHQGGLPDDLVLLDTPTLEWADRNGIPRPDGSEADKRRFHAQCCEVVFQFYKDHPEL